MAGSGSPGGDYRDGKGGDDYLRPYNRNGDGLKPLDSCLVPFRLALALQQDGWYVRSDIIWSKNNPMPESLNGWRWEKHRIKIKKSKRDPNKASELEHPQGDSRHNLESASVFEECPGCPICIPNDGYVLRQGAWRPTNSHEYIFMLTKTDKYYADREAVKETLVTAPEDKSNHSFGATGGKMEQLGNRLYSGKDWIPTAPVVILVLSGSSRLWDILALTLPVWMLKLSALLLEDGDIMTNLR